MGVVSRGEGEGSSSSKLATELGTNEGCSSSKPDVGIANESASFVLDHSSPHSSSYRKQTQQLQRSASVDCGLTCLERGRATEGMGFVVCNGKKKASRILMKTRAMGSMGTASAERRESRSSMKVCRTNSANSNGSRSSSSRRNNPRSPLLKGVGNTYNSFEEELPTRNSFCSNTSLLSTTSCDMDSADSERNGPEFVLSFPRICSYKAFSLDRSALALYSRRWFMLAVLCYALLVATMICNSISPAVELISSAYQTSLKDAYALSQLYIVVGILVCPFGVWVVDVKGVRISFLVGSAFLVVGSYIRFFATTDAFTHMLNRRGLNFPVLVLGQVFASCGFPFFAVLPAKVASEWFGPKERQIVAGFTWFSSCVGLTVPFITTQIALSLGSNISSVDDAKTVHHSVSKLLLFYGICCSPILPLGIVFLKRYPERPPSMSSIASSVCQLTLVESIKRMAATLHYNLLAFGLLLHVTSYISLMNGSQIYHVIHSYLNSHEASIEVVSFSLLNTFIAICIAAMGSTFLLVPILGRMAHKRQHLHYLVLKSSAVVGSGCMIWLSLSINPLCVLSVYGSIFFLTASIFVLVPFGLEMAADSVFPVASVVSSGWLRVSVFGSALLVSHFLKLRCYQHTLPSGTHCQLVGFPGSSRADELQDHKLQEIVNSVCTLTSLNILSTIVILYFSGRLLRQGIDVGIIGVKTPNSNRSRSNAVSGPEYRLEQVSTPESASETLTPPTADKSNKCPSFHNSDMIPNSLKKV
eukprot:Nk52_evm51s226 gene=Nk52_evmTU51s226